MNVAIKAGVLLSMFATSSAMAAWSGVVDWAQKTELSTATSGVVKKVPARAGDEVEKGASLLLLEQGALIAAVEASRAAVAQSKLRLEEAQRELERTEELYARTLLADHDKNLAHIAYADAKATHRFNQSTHAQAQEALRNSHLRAPFNAVVLARMVQPGQTIKSELRAEPLLIIARSGERLVRFNVTAAEVGAFKPGLAVSIEVDGKRYKGNISGVRLTDLTKDGKVPVEAVFATSDTLLPGRSASVSKP